MLHAIVSVRYTVMRPMGRGYSYLLVQETLEETTLNSVRTSHHVSGVSERYLKQKSVKKTSPYAQGSLVIRSRNTKSPGRSHVESGIERTRRIKQSTFTDHAVRHIGGGGSGVCVRGFVIIPIPREATSVATMMGLLPVLNSFRTQSRSFCCLSPWIARNN